MYFSLYRTGHQIKQHWLHLSIGVTTIGAKNVLHIEASLKLKNLLPTNPVHECLATVSQAAISAMPLPLQHPYLEFTTLGELLF